jgi:hypothetical protein
MRFFLSFIPLLAPFCFMLCSNPRAIFADEKEIIIWQENRPLAWDDFQGKPQKRFAAASTHYDIQKIIDVQKGDSIAITIQAVFFCKKSWKKESWISESVLRHEQKHFDIVELYARKLRKLINANNYSSAIELTIKSDSLYAIIDKEMDVYQDKYDDETDGSMNGEQQRAWEKKITNEISELEAYKNKSSIIYLQNKSN